MKSIDTARKYLGKQETAGANRGPLIDQWCADLSVPKGVYWCGVFVGHTLIEAYGLNDKATLRKALGFASPFYVDAANDWYQQSKTLQRVGIDGVTPGDLFVLLAADGRAEHIGFVITPPDEMRKFHTIEGNTNNGGSRNGDGVYERDRFAGPNVEFLHIPQELKA